MKDAYSFDRDLDGLPGVLRRDVRRLRAGVHALRAHVPVGEGAVGRDRRRHEPGVHGGRRGRRGRVRLVRALRLRREHRSRDEAGAARTKPAPDDAPAMEKVHTPDLPGIERRRRSASKTKPNRLLKSHRVRRRRRARARGRARQPRGERVRARRARSPAPRCGCSPTPTSPRARICRRATSAPTSRARSTSSPTRRSRAPHGWITGANEIDHHVAAAWCSAGTSRRRSGPRSRSSSPATRARSAGSRCASTAASRSATSSSSARSTPRRSARSTPTRTASSTRW